MNPAALNEQAPATFKAEFDTSQGPFVVEVHRDWAPIGADRFYNLVKAGFYDQNRFYRVIPKFVAQFGIHGDPEIAKAWLSARILDDPTGKQSNKRGTIAFVAAGINRRTTVVFINLADNTSMDNTNVPYGRVVSGVEVLDRLYSGYGDAAPTGKGPIMTPYYAEGNAYLERQFPRLDYMKTAKIVD
jgi:peptidyl-prolyl cis-trans isomerase A (cyclophilin A)